MNQNIKYLIENILDNFYDDQQYDIIEDFLGYKYFPKRKYELKKIIEEHYKNHNYNLNDIDVSQIIDFSNLFDNDKHTGYKDFDISRWNVSNGRDFARMFYGCKVFNCDLSHWDVSNGVDFSFMFADCFNFNSDLSMWVVSKANSFICMFKNCEKFNSDLSKWDISNCKYFSHMFYGCKNFNCDLSSWNVF